MIGNIYNSKGYRLLSKQTKIKVSRLKTFFNTNIPKNTSFMDIVEIESKFGNGQKKIVSYRNSDGTLLKRITKEKNDDHITKTTNFYNIDYLHEKFLGIFRKKEIDGQKIQDTNEMWSVVTGKNGNTLDHTKLTTTKLADGTMFEHQTYEEFMHKNSDRMYIETTATKDTNGTLSKKTISANVGDIKKLADDPFLFIRNYDNKNFTKEIFEYAKKKQQVENKKIHLGFMKQPGIRGSAFSKHILINQALNKNKLDIVDTINHELRHHYQRLLRKNLGFFNFILNRIPKNTNMTPEEIKLAKKYHLANLIYNPNHFNDDMYYRNFLEIDARNAGEKAQKEFLEYSEYLAELFPHANKKLFQIN